ncbi:MAG: glycosyltransferase family 2 protein [Pyrinomonadaceae bacterium]|nr:glycosyltransferase family 2 protein [Sphingobacteriaceae bacterium]
MDKIAAVVVTYNRLELLKECLNNLRQQTRKLDTILVIDNSSTDGTSDWLQQQDDLNVIVQENGGGAAGFYRGMKEAYEMGFDWIWVMDDDVEPSVTCLEEMLEANLSYNNAFDVLQPHRKFKDKEVDWHYGTKFNFTNPFQPHAVEHFNVSHLEERIKKFVSFPFEGPMFSKKVLEKIGFAEKRFFIWFDDTEYAARVHYAGFSAGLVKDAILIKKIIPPTKGIKIDWKMYYQIRNHIILDRKFGNPFIAISRAAFDNIHRMLVVTKQSFESKSFTNYFKDLTAIAKAIADGFRFKY